MMQDTVLVISLAAAFRGLAEERLTAGDLEKAVFFVTGSPRLTSEDVKEEMPGNLSRRDDLYHVVTEAVVNAEVDRRLAWQEAGDKWDQLNELLSMNRLPAITPVDFDHPKEGRYALAWVAKAAQNQKLPYRVVWS